MCLYFIRCDEYVKIGIANEPQKRLEALQTGNGKLLELAGIRFCLSRYEARKYEMALHRWLKHSRAKGEWFRWPKFKCYDSETNTIIYGDGGICLDSLIN